MTRQEQYIENLSKIIQKETVSASDDPDRTKFREMHQLLRQLFPNLFAVAEVEDFDGSLLLRWRGQDPGKDPVMFMNHHDVVEATGDWKYPPFCGEVHEGALWGRGTLDTKGGLWAMLQAGDELAAAGFAPSRDIYFESACDEETNGGGADTIVNTLKERGIRLAMSFDEGGMVMYDPIGGAKGTFAMVGVGEKGTCDLKFSAYSTGGHASTPPKDSPLVRLGKFMAAVERKPIFRRELSPTVKEMFRRVGAYMGGIGFVLQRPDFFEPLLRIVLPKISPTVDAMMETTLAFTQAHGSEGRNVLPQTAYVIGNMRFSHHEGRDASIDKLRPLAEKYGITIEILDPGCPSGVTDYHGTAFQLVEKAIRAVNPVVDEIVPYIMTGASDSRFVGKICDQCIRFLPFVITKEQMASIHGLNENINIDTLVQAVDYHKYLMQEV